MADKKICPNCNGDKWELSRHFPFRIVCRHCHHIEEISSNGDTTFEIHTKRVESKNLLDGSKMMLEVPEIMMFEDVPDDGR